MRTRRALIALVAVIALAAGSAAHAATWAIDNAHTTVEFKVRHIFTKVPGTFTKLTGTIDYDPANPEAGSVKVEIDAASITTRNERRDNHLRSADFFDVETFPTITFESTKVTARGESGLTVDGNLTMRGVTKPVTLEVTFLGANEAKAGFEGTTTVDRKDFGIVWNRTLDQGGMLLGDDVEIHIAVEANAPEKAKS